MTQPIRTLRTALAILSFALAPTPLLRAGDHECHVNFNIYKIGLAGEATLIGPTTGNWYGPFHVSLGLGETVRLLRTCPGCNNCPPHGVERRLGPAGQVAVFTDPVLDTLPFPNPTFTEAGSYFLRGVCNVANICLGNMQCALLVESSAPLLTTVAPLVHEQEGLSVTSVNGQAVVEHDDTGIITIIDASGRTMAEQQFTGSSDPQRLPLPGLFSGIYVVVFRSERGIVTRRFYHQP